MKEYYNKAEETTKAFTRISDPQDPDDDDKHLYFRTGDVVDLDPETSIYTIKGRTSTDIIKHKGYKVSALEIENVLLSHPNIKECSVVGLDHEAFGQSITAVVVKSKAIDADADKEVKSLQAWCSSRLASYQIPQQVHFVQEIPRNAMGKVNKKQLAKWISS